MLIAGLLPVDFVTVIWAGVMHCMVYLCDNRTGCDGLIFFFLLSDGCCSSHVRQCNPFCFLEAGVGLSGVFYFLPA